MRTTISASAARRSTIFPLPSSPHCVPTTAIVFITRSVTLDNLLEESDRVVNYSRKADISKTDRGCGGYRWDSFQTFDHRARHRLVHSDQAYRHSANSVSPEVKSSDVDAFASQYSAYGTHRAWHVPVMKHKEISFRNSLEAESVDTDQAQASLADHGAGNFQNS